MRITVLTYVEKETRDRRKADPVVAQVAGALERKGHEVAILGVHGDVRKLVAALGDRPPDLVFNMLEMFGDDVNGDIAITGLMDALGVRYTGCGPGELYLANDKALAKKILAFEGIQYPNFAVFGMGAELETGGNLRMPLFVKPARMDASIGIDAGGLVHDAPSLMKRVALIHKDFDDAALAEEYIDGRELYIGVLGNSEPLALPAIEIDFSGLREGQPHILDAKAKFDENSAAYKGTRAVIADLPDELRARLQKVAVGAYRALRVRDFGRVDIRLAPDGEIYVLEANANCYLEKDAEFAMAALAAGIEYDDLVARIVELARERHGM